MSQLPGQYPGPEERSPELSPSPPVFTYYPPPPPAPPAASVVSGPPRQQRRGLIGWLTALAVFIFGYAKYAFLLIKGVPALLTLSTLFVSFGLYAWYAGPAFAAALVTMILVHEMGHVVEIRRQGLKATAPVFIPFLGAAIFQREHPTTAVNQAKIGIAGPIAGTIGATAAMVLFNATQNPIFLLAATIGFFL